MRSLFFFLFVIAAPVAKSQQGWWQAQLYREDGNNIVFTFEWKTERGKPVWYIHNASEKIKVTNIRRTGDSIIVQMPVFESEFRVTYRNKKIEGVWKKGSSAGIQVIPFTAIPGKDRFAAGNSSSKNISGRWAAFFTDNKTADTTVAEFNQQGNQVTGTFLTASSDYRYLEGVVRNDSLFLSTFDGAHAYLFTAKIDNDKKLSGGMYYAGAKSKEEWTAVKNEKAAVPYDESAMYLKPGQERLNFKFNDLEGNPVSINDERFKNKVVIVQLMGSWCPNCMDETVFLSEYYNKNKQRGVEIVSLAYEYSTDIERSKKSLRKFQQGFNVQYPMLITGVAVTDSLRTEKTLPQLTPIKTFPSSIIIDKNGKVRKIETTFNGPGTGEHYLEYKKEFEATIDELLKGN
ncbi:MAG TPA: TlpA disulfide reductase family protein [Chitinophagaceae bacterium]|nr:TlpA disulfide reductase family protein [Chitinophagaceae bacterium]